MDLSRSGPLQSTASSTRSGHPPGGRSRSLGGGGGSGTGDEFGRAVAQAAVAQVLEAAGSTRAPLRSGCGRRRRPAVHLPLGQSSAFNANLTGRALAKEVDIIHALVEVGSDTDGFARVRPPLMHIRQERHDIYSKELLEKLLEKLSPDILNHQLQT